MNQHSPPAPLNKTMNPQRVPAKRWSLGHPTVEKLEPIPGLRCACAAPIKGGAWPPTSPTAGPKHGHMPKFSCTHRVLIAPAAGPSYAARASTMSGSLADARYSACRSASPILRASSLRVRLSMSGRPGIAHASCLSVPSAAPLSSAPLPAFPEDLH